MPDKGMLRDVVIPLKSLPLPSPQVETFMANRKIIKPKSVSGFLEWLPEQKLVEQRMLDTIREEFERFGFGPIETSAIERKEILAAKGIVEKEIYALSRLSASNSEDTSTELALHFDLTVPLARYVAQHFNSLVFPFRRYQIQKVWRGERPQAGRFREFYQCDIDVIGNGKLNLINDAELPLVIYNIFERLDIGEFVIRVNNRKILQGFLREMGLSADLGSEALRIIDSLEKEGEKIVFFELKNRVGLSSQQIDRFFRFIHHSKFALDPESKISPVELSDFCDDPLFIDGISELAEVVLLMHRLGLPSQVFEVDFSIARGLDYYTGTVYETNLVNNPEIGSICSGGRYDNLAGTYINQTLPGVGVSIGLTRLLSRLFDADLLNTDTLTPTKVLVTVMEPHLLGDCLGIAAQLRAEGINTEISTEHRKFRDQLKYADRKGIPVAIVAGESELQAGEIKVKELSTGAQVTTSRNDLANAVRNILNNQID